MRLFLDERSSGSRPNDRGRADGCGYGGVTAAEQLLRDAAAIQEATLGSSHADLATTLNNLAFVCERTNKIEEAERGYRRARAIAVASLPPGDPMIATSLKNLVDFCAAHRIPIWKPLADRVEDEASSPENSPALVQRTGPGRAALRAIALSALGVLVIVALALTMKERGPIFQNGSPVREETTPAVQRKPEPDIALDKPVETKNGPAEQPKPAQTSVTPTAVTVLNAQLCSVLEKTGSPDWQCTAAAGDLRPGTYTFYTGC